MLEEMRREDRASTAIEVQAAAHEIGAKLGIPVQSHRGAGGTREIDHEEGAREPQRPAGEGLSSNAHPPEERT